MSATIVRVSDVCEQIRGVTFSGDDAIPAAQLGYMASLGIIGTAIGFSTDARSALFWPRHEYYRRILCDALASLVEE